MIKSHNIVSASKQEDDVKKRNTYKNRMKSILKKKVIRCD